jgi:hypothetical protein
LIAAVKGADEVEQGRLAGPGATDNGDVFAPANAHVDAGQRADHPAVGVELALETYGKNRLRFS